MNYSPTVFFALLALLGCAAEQPPRYPDKLLYQPTPMPDRVILTCTSNPAISQAVTWRTDTSIARGLAQIAVSDVSPKFQANTSSVQTYIATTQDFDTELNKSRYHSVEFVGLKPKTKYVYRVGDGVNWSEWFAFETASDQPEPFGFIYVGDAQTEIRRHWSRVIRGAYADMPKAKFIVHAGDLVNTGSNDEEWGEWHSSAGWINGMVPSFPTPGNHEYINSRPKTEAFVGIAAAAQEKSPSKLTPHWRAQYTLPLNGPPGLEESAFHMDYQGVRFISLNSNEKIDAQVPWLEKLLKDNPNRWTILTFHAPIYSPVKGRDNKTLREKWRPLFDKYGVDLVLTGHDHTYGRSGVMREDVELSFARQQWERGTVYVVSVSGPKLYDLDTSATWMRAKAEKMQLYQLIRIDGDTLHYEARDAEGKLFDEFELNKGSHGNVLLEKDELESARLRKHNPSRSQLLYATGAMFILALIYAGYRLVTRKRTA